MKIGGFLKFSLIDYPGHIAAVIFTQGCAFKCSYCHNPELVLPQHFQKTLDLEEILKFLNKRKGKLDGIVISGGEPTIQEDLEEVIGRMKTEGWKIKLDSSGIRPDVLRKLIENKSIDYIAMDIKAPLDKYIEITPTHVPISKIKESIDLIKSSPIPYEFRSTLLASIHSPEDLISMAKTIEGAKLYVLQTFRPEKTLDPKWKYKKEYLQKKLLPMQEEIERYVETCAFR